MAWVHLLGRKFAAVLCDPEFELLLDWPYWNRFHQKGHSYYGCCRGRRFCMSQSRQNDVDSMENLARVFRDGDLIDTHIGPFYRNSKGQEGLLSTAWNGGQWLQMISPGTHDQPRDSFSDLAQQIHADHTFDPQPLDLTLTENFTERRLQELMDVLRNVQGRRDFYW